jgi:hypothetical protein
LSYARKTVQKAINVLGCPYWEIMYWQGVGDKSTLAVPRDPT